MNKSNVSNQEITDFLKANIDSIIKYRIDPDRVETQTCLNKYCAESFDLDNNDVCDFTLKSGRTFLSRVTIKDKVKNRKRKRQ